MQDYFSYIVPFGTGAEVSWVRSVLGPKCPGSECLYTAGYRATSLNRPFYLSSSSVMDVMFSLWTCCDMLSSSSVVSRYACVQSSSIIFIPYLCARFRFCCSLHCWASLWKKSPTQSIIHPDYLECLTNTDNFGDTRHLIWKAQWHPGYPGGQRAVVFSGIRSHMHSTLLLTKSEP